MQNRLKWLNFGGAADSILIYRAATKILDSALPAPLATLAGNVTEYIDTAIVRNVPYHYRIGIMKNGELALSPNRCLAVMPYTGPGPQTLLRGDYDYGYFGRVKADEFLTAEDIYRIFSLTQDTGATIGTTTFWVKLVSKGKIYFFPDAGVASGISLSDIYRKGLVYGHSDSNLYNEWLKTTYGIIDQSKVFETDNHQFKIRLPISRINPGALDSDTNGWTGGELDQLIGPLLIDRTIEPKLNIMDDISWETSAFLIADFANSGSTSLVRSGASMSAYSTAAVSSGYKFRPILELVL